MDGFTAWDFIKTIVSWAWMPIMAYMSFKNNKDNRQADWRDSMEKRMSEAEASDRLHSIQIEILKETLKEVKQGIDKLIDRLINKK